MAVGILWVGGGGGGWLWVFFEWWCVVVDRGGSWWMVAQFIITRSKILRENKIFLPM